MNRDLDSLLRGPLAIAAALALALLVLAALTAQGVTAIIVPPPDEVGQQFFTSLKAHNFDAAQQDLSEALRQQVTPGDLRDLARRLEAATHGIVQASGEDPQTQGDTATAQVRLTFQDGRERTVDVAFTREQGLWQISSLAPLQALIE